MPPPLELDYTKPSPSRACEVKYTSMVWTREGGRGVGSTRPEQAGRRDGGGRPPAQRPATRKRAGALFTALRAGMTMLLPSLIAAAPLVRSRGAASRSASFLKKA